MRWAQSGGDPFSLTHFPHHALHTRSIPRGLRPGSTPDSHQTPGSLPGFGPPQSEQPPAQRATLTTNRRRRSNQWESVTPTQARLPPLARQIETRELEADQTISCGNGLSYRTCSFLKATVPAASVQPQGSANFPVANGILSQTRRDTSGLQEEF